MELYRMWIDELARRERALDNFLMGDLVLAGRSADEAAQTVADDRRTCCLYNQAQLCAATSFEARCAVVQTLLAPIWAKLALRPEAVVARFMYALEAADPATIQTLMDPARRAIADREDALHSAGLDEQQHLDLFRPLNSYAETAHHQCLMRLAETTAELDRLRPREDHL
jgi:hypothetical protein